MTELRHQKKSRLFVPLSKEAFEWFKIGKKWEIRRFNRGQYNLKNITLNRDVELRRGYNGESLWGLIEDVKVFSNSRELVYKINYLELIPTAQNEAEAIKFIDSYVAGNDQLIVFKISNLEYNSSMEDRKYIAKSIKLADRFHELVVSRKKVSTIRLGFVFFTDNTFELRFASHLPIKVRLLKLDYSKKISDLDEKDALTDGFESLSVLLSELRTFYPGASENSQMTIISFVIIPD